MDSSMQRINEYFSEFEQGLARTQNSAEVCDAADLKDIYNRLARLRDRYLHERTHGRLTPTQITALDKVFENDVFIKGLCEMRQIGEHVVARRPEGAKIFTTNNIPIELAPSCSAKSVFSDYDVTLPTAGNGFYPVNHLRNLEEAKKRIIKALSKAKDSE